MNKTISTERLILAAGLALRLVGLGHGNLWHDEAFTGLVSPLPWARFWSALLGDVHPPLWYLIERGSLAVLGRQAWALRLPAALLSCAALLLFWRIASRSGLPRPGQLAALALMAFSPFQIYYAQEARMYAGLTLAALLLLAAVLERRPWLFAAGALLATWLHNLGAIYVLAALLALAAHEIRGPADVLRLLIGWWPAGLLTLVLAAPALIWTLRQAGVVAGGYWIIDRSIGAWLYNAVFCPLAGQGVIDSRLSWNASLAALVLGLAGLLVGIRQRRWAWLLAGWLPGLIMLAVSTLVRPMLLARTLIGASPALYLLAGQLFDTRRRRIALALLIAPVLISGLSRHYMLERRGDTAPLVAAIQAEHPALVLHSQSGGWILFQWQLPGLEQALWDGAYGGLASSVSDQTAAALEIERVSLAEAPRPLAVIYVDYALVSPFERVSILGELQAAGGELAYTLADDEWQRIDLWMVR